MKKLRLKRRGMVGEDEEITIEAAWDGSSITLTYNPTETVVQQQVYRKVGLSNQIARKAFNRYQAMLIRRLVDGKTIINTRLPNTNFVQTRDPTNPQELVYAPIHFVPVNAQTQPEGHVVQVNVPSWGVGDVVITELTDRMGQMIATLRQLTKPQYPR